MASWTLGQIYSVDEEKEATQEPSVSGEADSDDDDDDVLERQAAFNKNKQKNNSSVCPVTGSNRSIRRYDEFGDFLTRSERAHQEKAKAEQAKLSKIVERQESGVKGKVAFREGEKLEEVHEIPSITDEEKKNCFMGTENWVSIDNDIELTTKRWTNHVEGTIPFDEDNNTIRGIEDMIFKIDKQKPILKHRKTILEEVVRQKTSNEYPNWEKLSALSKSSSEAQTKLAIELAKEDEKEKNRVWAPKQPGAEKKAVTPPAKQDKKGKRKSSFFGLFKKK